MQTTATHTSSAPSLSGFTSTLPGKVTLGFAATLVVAAAAHIAFPVPFSPVPFTLQPLAVLGVGLALGPLAGFLTMLAYLAEGALGLPVFTPAGPGGVAQIIGPTGGFLMAYPIVAAITGGLTRMLQRRLPTFAAATIGGAVAVVVLFLSGASWPMLVAHVSASTALGKFVLPFLPGEAVKVLAAAGVYRALARPVRS